jgi:hypothetical protein
MNNAPIDQSLNRIVDTISDSVIVRMSFVDYIPPITPSLIGATRTEIESAIAFFGLSGRTKVALAGNWGRYRSDPSVRIDDNGASRRINSAAREEDGG